MTADDLLIGIGLQEEYGTPAEILHYAPCPSPPIVPMAMGVFGPPPGSMKTAGAAYNVAVAVPYGPVAAAYWRHAADFDENGQGSWFTVELAFRHSSSAGWGFRWHSAKLCERSIEFSVGSRVMLHLDFTAKFCEPAPRPPNIVPKVLAYDSAETAVVMRGEDNATSRLPIAYYRVGQRFSLRSAYARKPLRNTGDPLWRIEFATASSCPELMAQAVNEEVRGLELVCRRGDEQTVIGVQANVTVCKIYIDDESDEVCMVGEGIGEKSKDGNAPAGVWG